MPFFLKNLSYSPISARLIQGDESKLLYKVELQDYVRAFCGALFFAVPLHYTMEMWERARVMADVDLIIVTVLAYLANVGYSVFSGHKDAESRKAPWWDAAVSLSVGMIASAITLLLMDQITHQISFEITVKMIALEALPTSFGASLARNQLGGGDPANKPHLEDQFSVDVRKLMGTTLGSLMFAFNIAPTAEPIIIANSLGWHQVIMIMIFSVIVSYAMNFMANFVQEDDDGAVMLSNDWVETFVSYAIALIVSAALLWTFGYLTIDTPLDFALPWIIVLGYVTNLGGSAGRLVL
ncbi:hypothetical protein CEQ90_10575 [Lewinellaceae bacterium SD302]|nr:hypothetical protein CEQ90_10575 [Lewinellaceae bacterium SD302]